jgi:hypothetical protein
MNIKKTLTILIFLVLLCSYNFSFADVYQYTDGEGMVQLTEDSKLCKKYNCKLIMKEKSTKINNVKKVNNNKSSVLVSDYIMKKGEYVYDSAFQIEHIASLDREAGIGYINDQLERKTIIMTANDEIVKIVDSCSFCRLDLVKVKAINGKGSGWVLRSSLAKVKSK